MYFCYASKWSSSSQVDLSDMNNDNIQLSWKESINPGYATLHATTIIFTDFSWIKLNLPLISYFIAIRNVHFYAVDGILLNEPFKEVF